MASSQPNADAPPIYEPQGGEQEVTAADEAITAFKKPYAFLTNFSVSPVEYEGVTYKTVEHAYQAAKTLDPAWREKIQGKANPGWARQTGKGKAFPMRPDWDQVHLGVMRELLRQKFAAPKRAAQLLSTGQRQLIEGNHWGDIYWGAVLNANGEWEGANHLGKILMEIREELASKDEPHPQ